MQSVCTSVERVCKLLHTPIAPKGKPSQIWLISGENGSKTGEMFSKYPSLLVMNLLLLPQDGETFVPAETAHVVESIKLPSTESIFGSTAGMREIQEEIERSKARRPACPDRRRKRNRQGSNRPVSAYVFSSRERTVFEVQLLCGVNEAAGRRDVRLRERRKPRCAGDHKWRQLAWLRVECSFSMRLTTWRSPCKRNSCGPLDQAITAVLAAGKIWP